MQKNYPPKNKKNKIYICKQLKPTRISLQHVVITFTLITVKLMIKTMLWKEIQEKSLQEKSPYQTSKVTPKDL